MLYIKIKYIHYQILSGEFSIMPTLHLSNYLAPDHRDPKT